MVETMRFQATLVHSPAVELCHHANASNVGGETHALGEVCGALPRVAHRFKRRVALQRVAQNGLHTERFTHRTIYTQNGFYTLSSTAVNNPHRERARGFVGAEV